ncbi:hypothetical protein LEMLEM_LOCUS23027 [Lemmus lemmus]
MTTRLSAKGA